MRVSEQQLIVLLSIAKKAVDGTLEEELQQDGIRDAVSRLYDEIMIQQNEIVDTSNHPNPTRDQYLRLVFDMFESLEFTAKDPQDFYESPMGKRALAIMYPDDRQQERVHECEHCNGRGFTMVEKEGEECSPSSDDS